MSEKVHYLIKEETLQQIAQAVRNKTNETGEIVVSELADKINNIESGGLDTSDATAAAADILAGKTAYVDGEKITGTIPSKSASNLTESGGTVTVPAGYYATQATKSVATAAQATPSITVNSSTGLITATATQTAGYVSSGTKSATKQLAFQAAKTITPGTANQTVVTANTYVGGAITVKGDSNLIAGNIKKGTSIFGVAGDYEGSGSSGGDTSMEDRLVTGDFTTYMNSRVKEIRHYAFYSCTNLTSVSFPVCSYIGSYAFYSCTNLTSVSFPACSYIGNYAFYYCPRLTSVNFPVCSYIGSNVFYYCSRLTSVSFPVCSYIGNYAFGNCSSLTLADFGNSTSKICTIYASAFRQCSKITTLILRYGSVITLSNVNAFASTPMSVSTLTGSFGSIYVPASLVAAYKSATNWATYANRITAIAE